MEKRKDKMIVAVSGGPDSMALLDMTRENNVTLYCAHVNYHQRDSAQRDQAIVEVYCEKHKIPCFIKHFNEPLKGNFQKQARDFRYQFFVEMAQKLEVKTVLVAHHKDDVIETYIMQKERGSTPSYYGLNKQIIYKGINILRPLLNYTKQDLIDYLNKKEIIYGVDESNQSTKYTRNKIRKEKVDLMSAKEKKEIIIEIETLNANKTAGKRASIEVDALLQQEDQVSYLRSLFEEQPSTDHIIEMISQIAATKKRLVFEVKGQLLIKEYGKIKLEIKPQSYEVKIEQNTLGDYPWFKIVNEADRFHSATVTSDDFPLTIRSPQPKDKIKLPYGTKSIARWFIDNKISYIDRMHWPIVLNKHQEIILVPKIGCSFEYYSNNPNLFVIK